MLPRRVNLRFVAQFDSTMLDCLAWAISSGGERFLHTEEATGSIPVSPTIFSISSKTTLSVTRNTVVVFVSRVSASVQDIHSISQAL
jgi:hypothetical protein